MLIVKGKNFTATLAAFAEVFIWFLIAREALSTDINSIFIPIAYAGGYAAGTYIGIVLSKVLIDGIVSVQAVIDNYNDDIVKTIREKGYGVSIIPLECQTASDRKVMLHMQINKKELNNLMKLIKSLDSDSFITVSETKYVRNGFIK
jgi:uncharacterized protein YebE (UPF0316 family)